MSELKTKYKLVLASNSPRRRQLLGGLDVPFEVHVIKGVAEDYPQGMRAEDIPQYISREKAAAYNVKEDEMLITADTVVIVDGEVLGKPADEAEAAAMLRKISGKTHHVTTGVTLTTTSQQRSFHVTTEVTFKTLSKEEIDYYIKNYRPFDKAGAYGIQEWIGYIGVTGIRGSFYNVMGLPVQRIYEEIMRM